MSARLFPLSGERLVMVELHSGSPSALPGELERFGNFAVISASYDSDLHMVAGMPTLYGEQLAARERSFTATGQSLVGFTGVDEDFSDSPRLLSAPAINSDTLVKDLRQLSGDLPVTLNGKELRLALGCVSNMRRWASRLLSCRIKGVVSAPMQILSQKRSVVTLVVC